MVGLSLLTSFDSGSCSARQPRPGFQTQTGLPDRDRWDRSDVGRKLATHRPEFGTKVEPGNHRFHTKQGVRVTPITTPITIVGLFKSQFLGITWDYHYGGSLKLLNLHEDWLSLVIIPSLLGDDPRHLSRNHHHECAGHVPHVPQNGTLKTSGSSNLYGTMLGIAHLGHMKYMNNIEQ